MGGGGGIIKAITNPAGTIANQVLGGNNDIAKGVNAVGGFMGAGGVGGGATTALMGGAGQGAVGPNGQPIDPGAKPTMTPFESQRNADGSIKSVYQTQNSYDPRAINALRTEALRDPGTQSKWAQMAGANAGNQIAGQQAGQLSMAQNNLAMSGGLRSGARERLANQSQQTGLMAKQNAYNQIAQQDEQQRVSSLGNLAGQELGVANQANAIQDTNINRATGDVGQERAYEMNKYNEAMRAWAAQNTANAMPQAQDKGFVGNIFGSLGL